MKIAQILMVEDNEGDVLLTRMAIKRAKMHLALTSVGDGVDAMDYLHKRGKFTDAVRPDLILLDLNLPRMNGAEVLAAIKADSSLRRIPVVVLSGSKAEADLSHAYDLHANCYIVKPVGAKEFEEIVGHLENFWLSVVTPAPNGSMPVG
ncbi:MAG: response regulator [Acidobacteriota bacterium]